jgi:hypothetical protein
VARGANAREGEGDVDVDVDADADADVDAFEFTVEGHALPWLEPTVCPLPFGRRSVESATALQLEGNVDTGADARIALVDSLPSVPLRDKEDCPDECEDDEFDDWVESDPVEEESDSDSDSRCLAVACLRLATPLSIIQCRWWR